MNGWKEELVTWFKSGGSVGIIRNRSPSAFALFVSPTSFPSNSPPNTL